MKKWICVLLSVLCALPVAACRKKDAPAPRVWCLQPPSVAAETEIKQMIRYFDASAYVSFVPSEELNMRLGSAMERGEAPDVFMLYADDLPDWAEEKKVEDLTNRIGVSKVQPDELQESARRACLYQGKTWAVPLFTDLYMLATNRALVATPPDTVEQLLAVTADLSDGGVSSFEKLPPEKRSMLFEAALSERGGNMLNKRKTELTFASESGQAALADCVRLMQTSSDQKDAMASGKAAFSILTMRERQEQSEKYPDAEVELSPLFGLNRLQTVAVALGPDSADQARAFRMLEFLQTKSEELAALYKCYGAQKELTPLSPRDKEGVVQLSEATPSPDLCGYRSLLATYLPSAIDKAGKGMNAADALQEAARDASGAIWRGKRE